MLDIPPLNVIFFCCFGRPAFLPKTNKSRKLFYSPGRRRPTQSRCRASELAASCHSGVFAHAVKHRGLAGRGQRQCGQRAAHNSWREHGQSDYRSAITDTALISAMYLACDCASHLAQVISRRADLPGAAHTRAKRAGRASISERRAGRVRVCRCMARLNQHTCPPGSGAHASEAGRTREHQREACRTRACAGTFFCARPSLQPRSRSCDATRLRDGRRDDTGIGLTRTSRRRRAGAMPTDRPSPRNTRSRRHLP